MVKCRSVEELESQRVGERKSGRVEEKKNLEIWWFLYGLLLIFA